ncbi:MAG: glucosidase [bacterium]|nr:glucosidase [bacterium]
MKSEKRRIAEEGSFIAEWKKWGPYLSERQWGTVREDYSIDGSAWEYFTFDDALSRVYRWGEDGIAGISDNEQLLCFAPAFWNGKDPFIKERFFGLTHDQGNKGEAVKELYHYLDNTPTHSYMVMLYKYPQEEFPYQKLILENINRESFDPDYNLIDTGVFRENRYFDIFIEYAKKTPEDILIRISVHNRGPEESTLYLIPQLWFRNILQNNEDEKKSVLFSEGKGLIQADNEKLDIMYFYAQNEPEMLFCDNESVSDPYSGETDENRYFKNGINEYIVNNNGEAVNREKKGTKAAVLYKLDVSPREPVTVNLRLTNRLMLRPFSDFQKVFSKRIRETDRFYREIIDPAQTPDIKNIQRQGAAGLLWTKQYYNYNIREKLEQSAAPGDSEFSSIDNRNKEWLNIRNDDIVSVPDKWKNPWYSSWDTAFTACAMADIDPEFAKNQLYLLTTPRFMHNTGKIPADEWNFDKVIPPIHAWAAWHVYSTDKDNNKNKGDLIFLESVFQKLMLNYNWWLNQKDASGNNVLQGGVFGFENNDFCEDPNADAGSRTIQACGISWMTVFCIKLMAMAVELSQINPVYQETAVRLLDEFFFLGKALKNTGPQNIDIWDEDEGFYFDRMIIGEDDNIYHTKIPSITGIIPLLAVEVLNKKQMKKNPDFDEWISGLDEDHEFAENIKLMKEPGQNKNRLFSLTDDNKIHRILGRLFSESGFLSQFGLSTSCLDKTDRYGTFSRIWFPLNFLVIETLKKYHTFYGNELKIGFPTGSGNFVSLQDAAVELSKKLLKLFEINNNGRRISGDYSGRGTYDPNFDNYIDFYEYFDPVSGKGYGALHKTGWTGLINNIISNLHEERKR